MAVGNRVFLKRPMPSQELLDGFAGLPAANIADTMGALLRHESQNQAYERLSGDHGGSGADGKSQSGRQPVSPSGAGHGSAG